MKTDIHPKYETIKVTCACGNIIDMGTTMKELRVDVCSSCHPFYTGTQKFVDTAGRVDKFKKKMEAAETMRKAKTTDSTDKKTDSADKEKESVSLKDESEKSVVEETVEAEDKPAEPVAEEAPEVANDESTATEDESAESVVEEKTETETTDK